MTVDVVLNRNAGRLGETSPVRRALIDAAERHGARVHETWTLGELDRAAADLAERGTSAVVLAGGDGSHGAGVSALAKAFGGRPPPVAFAPGGTVGVVVRNLARPGRGAEGARAAEIVRAVCEGTAREANVPTLRVRDDAGVDRVAFIFGTGLVARFFEVYDAAPRAGIATAAALAGRALVGSITGSAFAARLLTPVACTVAVDGAERRSRAWSLVLASVVPHVGLGVRATYRAGEQLDRFHVVASTRSPRGLATQVPRVLTGRAMTGDDHVDDLARELRVTFPDIDGYVVDGDAGRARTVTVEAGPVLRVRLG